MLGGHVGCGFVAGWPNPDRAREGGNYRVGSAPYFTPPPRLLDAGEGPRAPHFISGQTDFGSPATPTRSAPRRFGHLPRTPRHPQMTLQPRTALESKPGKLRFCPYLMGLVTVRSRSGPTPFIFGITCTYVCTPGLTRHFTRGPLNTRTQPNSG